jgi:hypothetical protein
MAALRCEVELDGVSEPHRAQHAKLLRRGIVNYGAGLTIG